VATESWSSALNHSNDAGFRAWGSELSSKLAAVGLVQTSDSGQINWASVSRAGVNSDAGYEVWRMDDTLQATAPVFIKLLYGTSGLSTTPRLRVQVGTGSDGSGNLTGTRSNTITCSVSTISADTTTLRQSYLCVTEGFVGLALKTDGSASGRAFAGFILCRSSDPDGTPNSDALFICTGATAVGTSAAGANQSLNFVDGVAYTLSNQFPCLIPGAETTSVVGSDLQAHLFFMIKRRVSPVFGVCATYVSEISAGTTFTATLIGSTPRTYLQLARQLGTHWSADSQSLHGLCMLWE